MTAARVTFALLGAIAIGGGATYFALTGGGRSAPPTATEEEPTPTPRSPAPAAAAPGASAETERPGADGSGPGANGREDPAAGMLELPNGGYVEPLNGVKNPPKLLWNNPEWSPIVRKMHDDGLGIDWYIHADGSYSTTLMIDRPDLGRPDAVSYSLHPREPVPLAPRASDLPQGTILPGK